jgi:ADP-L-glycero-D-manno-heptose 6-epimerase
MTLQRVIVTGGAGFIGRNVIAALNEQGVTDILLVDDLGHGPKWRNLLDLDFADIMSIDEFRYNLRHDLLQQVDAVIHLGACSSTTETNADYLLDNNYRYSRELCQWCLDKDIRFVYASSAATYGDGSLGYSDDLELLPRLRPLNMYGYSKHLFDLWVLHHGLFDRVVGLKYFNVYGPGEAHKGDMRSVVHKAWGQIRETGRVRLFKSYRREIPDGGQTRDFVYVRDAVAVTLFFAAECEVGGLFNVGTGVARTWNDLAAAVFAAMGRPVQIEYIEMPPEIRDRYQYHTQAEIQKLRNAGYDTPFTPLEEGVRDYVAALERGETD